MSGVPSTVLLLMVLGSPFLDAEVVPKRRQIRTALQGRDAGDGPPALQVNLVRGVEDVTAIQSEHAVIVGQVCGIRSGTTELRGTA